MTARPDAPELSAAERQRVDRIEAAPAAEESWFIRKIVADELRAAADDIDDWAANAQRYRATVATDSIENAAATARLLAYERAGNVLRRRAQATADPQ